mgnify:CR=1 FL=1
MWKVLWLWICKNSEGVPHCECGGDIKPDVVLYEEGLDEEIVEKAIKAIEEADVLIIGGTSLIVYPAAGLIDYYKGDKLVLINKTMTIRDSRADLVINDSLGKVFSENYGYVKTNNLSRVYLYRD